jgi:hypothetical protein
LLNLLYRLTVAEPRPDSFDPELEFVQSMCLRDMEGLIEFRHRSVELPESR